MITDVIKTHKRERYHTRVKRFVSYLLNMSNEVLSESEIDEKIEELEIWGLVGEKLATRIEFDNYKEAAFFANSVFAIAEKMNHHPKLTVEYGAVNIDVSTHEADGLTEKAFKFAEKVEENLGEMDWS